MCTIPRREKIGSVLVSNFRNVVESEHEILHPVIHAMELQGE
jgi:hypothetical protein